VKLINCDQGTPEWHAARCGIPTASSFDKVMAVGRGNSESVTRRNYIAQLVVERLTGKQPGGGFENASTRQGKEREPLARRAYYLKTGNLVEEVGFCLDDEIACGASPDGLVEDDGGLELKCPEINTHMEYLLRDGMPPEYRWQVQGNLMVTGRKWWDFCSYNPDFPEHLQLLVRRVRRDDIAIMTLRHELKKFLAEVEAKELTLRQLKNVYA
jgi:hypothetical protein